MEIYLNTVGDSGLTHNFRAFLHEIYCKIGNRALSQLFCTFVKIS